MKNLVLALALMLSVPAMSQQKIAVVDTQKALLATKAGKDFKAAVEGDVAKRKKELDKRKADFDKMVADFDKKRAVLSEEVQNRKQMELQEEQLKLQKFFGENQLEIQKKEKEMLEPLIERMRKVVEKVSREKGFQVVLEKNGPGVLFATNEVDLTTDVITEFEKTK